MIDIVVLVDDCQDPAYRNPGAVARALTAQGYPTRSVTAIDQANGLTSIFRDTEAERP